MCCKYGPLSLYYEALHILNGDYASDFVIGSLFLWH